MNYCPDCEYKDLWIKSLLAHELTTAEIESQVMSELADHALTTRGIIRRVCELAGLKVVDNNG